MQQEKKQAACVLVCGTQRQVYGEGQLLQMSVQARC